MIRYMRPCIVASGRVAAAGSAIPVSRSLIIISWVGCFNVLEYNRNYIIIQYNYIYNFNNIIHKLMLASLVFLLSYVYVNTVTGAVEYDSMHIEGYLWIREDGQGLKCYMCYGYVTIM